MGSGGTEWELNDDGTFERMNQKTNFIGTGSQIAALGTTYAGQTAYCTSSGSGFVLDNTYKRNAANDAWVLQSKSQEGDMLYPLDTEIGNYTTPSAAVGSSAAEDNTQNSLYVTQAESDSGFVLASGNKTRCGLKLGASSALIGVKINAVDFFLGKNASPTGTATAVVRDSGDSIVFTFGTLDVSTLSTTDAWINFENLGSSHTLASGDKILLEYSGGDTTNRVDFGYEQLSDPYDSTNTFLTSYAGSYSDATSMDCRFRLYTTQFSAVLTIDDDTATQGKTNSEASPYYYYDMGSAKELVAIAINLDRTNTNLTTLLIDYSTDTTFSGEQVRTMLVTDFTDDTWRFIMVPRQTEDRRYFRISSPDTGVLAINEVKYLAKDATAWARAKHYHVYISPTDTNANSEDSD